MAFFVSLSFKMRTSELEATVIVPAYCAEKTLENCIVSLLRQEAPFSFEVVVVDNKSPDNTLAIVRNLVPGARGMLRVATEIEPGAYAARNHGIRESRGRYLLFTDADCKAEPGWVASLVDAFQDPTLLLVGGEVLGDPDQQSLVARWARAKGILSQRHTLNHPMGPYLQTANLAVRRTDALAVNGFDPRLLSGGDADFCWRLRRLRPDGALRFLPRARVLHVHRNSAKDLFRQHWRYGSANVTLATIHRGNYLHLARGLFTDLVILFALPLFVLTGVVAAVLRRDLLPVASPIFRVIRMAGYRLGQASALLMAGKRRWR